MQSIAAKVMLMSTLKNASIKQLENELNKRKQAKITELKNKRATIDKEINSLSSDKSTVKPIRLSDDKPRSKRLQKVRKAMSRSRVASIKSLNEHLVSVSKDGVPRSINEFITALEKDGWKSSSNKPYYVVAASLNTLAKKHIFNRVSKGSYALNKTGDKIEEKSIDSLNDILGSSDSNQ
jgi:uncharacterized protein YdbL (DUF1318 family)